MSQAAINAITHTHQDALRGIKAEPDRDLAYREVSELADTLQQLYEATTVARLEIIGRMWADDDLSFGKLADRIGLSKARAAQLIRTWKSSRSA